MARDCRPGPKVPPQAAPYRTMAASPTVKRRSNDHGPGRRADDHAHDLGLPVGVAGFEPTASSSRTPSGLTSVVVRPLLSPPRRAVGQGPTVGWCAGRADGRGRVVVVVSSVLRLTLRQERRRAGEQTDVDGQEPLLPASPRATWLVRLTICRVALEFGLVGVVSDGGHSVAVDRYVHVLPTQGAGNRAGAVAVQLLLLVQDETERADQPDVVSGQVVEGGDIRGYVGVGPAPAEFDDLVVGGRGVDGGPPSSRGAGTVVPGLGLAGRLWPRP